MPQASSWTGPGTGSTGSAAFLREPAAQPRLPAGVEDRDRVDLDQVPGSGQCLYPHYRVGRLVIAKQPHPGLFDHWQVLGPVMNDIDRDLGDLPGAGTGGRQGAAEIGEHLTGLGRQVTGAGEIAL